jgi:hypothetical protein
VRFWLAVALLVGTAVGVNAQHEQAQWSAHHAALLEVAPAAAVSVTADRLAPADLPLVWRVPWLSGVAANAPGRPAADRVNSLGRESEPAR